MITQEDRDAAKYFRRGIGGGYDRKHTLLEKAFAAHRIAAEQAVSARIAKLEAEIARLKGPITTYKRGFGPADGDEYILEQQP